MRQKIECLTYYSNSDNPECECCGEREIEFLALEHKQKNGNAHRLAVSGSRAGGEKTYSDLRKRGYPDKGDFGVLCHNCNMSASYHDGTCIHELKAA